MFTTSENPVTALIVLAAAVMLVWGLYRARKYGKLGRLAWLQSVVLMAPWLLFLGLFGLGIYINLATVLFLIVASAGLYIYLGKKKRAAGTDSLLQQRLSDKIKSIEETSKELKKKEAIEETLKEKETAEKESRTKEIIQGLIPSGGYQKNSGYLASIHFLLQKLFPIGKEQYLREISEENQQQFANVSLLVCQKNWAIATVCF